MENDHLTLIADPDRIETLYPEGRDKTKATLYSTHQPADPISSSPRSQSTGEMTFSSSPVLYPLSSSPPAITHKRKLFQSFHPRAPSPKKSKILGGFLVDDDSDAEHELDLNGSTDVGLSANSEERTRIESEPAQQTEEKQLEIPDSLEQASPSESTKAAPTQISSRSRLTSKTTEIITCSGRTLKIANRRQTTQQSYEQTIAQRSVTASGKAKKAYYGIDIQDLVDEAKIQIQLNEAAAEHRRQSEAVESVEVAAPQAPATATQLETSQMWTEKYRAKKFTDLVGDERTHRSVLRWLKSWDETVFPGNNKLKPKRIYEDQDQQHKKILLLTGPPGLGKTTLAHVCAKQAGYEVLEINASDDRSRDVVRGRIKDAVGTETVRGIKEHGKARKAGRPVCVVVDEVDGVVSGSGGTGGEGGFMKALIDLVQLDLRNSSGQQTSSKTKKKDKFRLMRPLILICNDVYAPSLRPLRQSSIAEIIHVRKPALEKVISRLKSVFEKEHVACDNDAIRRLCESSWGLGTRKQNSLGSRGAGEGDIRAVLVQSEWMAHKLRASSEAATRLTRKWVEDQIGNAKASQTGLGRGGVREVVERVFIEGAGLPNLPTSLTQDEARLVAESKSNPIGVADLRKRSAISALREMIDTTGEHDRLMTDCFATYPTQTFQDDTLLSKPNASYEWLYFHDRLSSKVFSSQEWELTPYLSTSACGFHDLFAAIDKGSKGWNDGRGEMDGSDQDSHPFSGLKADFAAHESQKMNHTTLTEMQARLSAPLLRLFSTVETIALELVPNVNRMLGPEVKPVVVGGSGATASVASVRKESERNCVKNAVRAMCALGIEFEKMKIESEGFGAHTNGGYALRMEPPIDSLATFHITKSPSSTNTATTTNNFLSNSTNKISSTYTPTAPTRYAVRQVLAQELAKEKAIQANLARQARAGGLSTTSLTTHPLAGTGTNSPFSAHDRDKENQNPHAISSKTLDNINQITAIAASTASLSSAPGSSTVLNTNTAMGPVKRDFFGRPIHAPRPVTPGASANDKGHARRPSSAAGRHVDAVDGTGEAKHAGRTWVSFHEGYSNAVRRYIGLRELMDGF